MALSLLEMLDISLKTSGDSSLYSIDQRNLSIERAKESAWRLRFPFRNGTKEEAIRYVGNDWLVRYAIADINSIGVEEQDSHSENGISRSWSGGVFAKLKSEVIPVAKGIGIEIE